MSRSKKTEKQIKDKRSKRFDYVGDKETESKLQEIELYSGDCLYFFTDGFADQFGGEKGKKFKYKPFKRLLIEMHIQPMTDQAQLIFDTFENWKGDFEQVDDVCVIGIKI